MTIRDMLYLTTIGEEKSITKAANKLFVAQPALSQCLQKIEKELGTEIFVRTSSGVRPTVDAGDQVTVEPWLLDFEGNLYGKSIRVEFLEFLRPERKFPSLEALRAAILQNAEETRAFFRTELPS